MGLNYVEGLPTALSVQERGLGTCSIRKVSLLAFFNARHLNRFEAIAHIHNLHNTAVNQTCLSEYN